MFFTNSDENMTFMSFVVELVPSEVMKNTAAHFPVKTFFLVYSMHRFSASKIPSRNSSAELTEGSSTKRISRT